MSLSTHTTSPVHLHDIAILTDVRAALPYMPSNSIHLTFTSPPYYNARAYAHYASYAAYLDFLSDVFTSIHRITKEGRFLIVNTSPVIEPRAKRSKQSKRYAIPFDLHARLTAIGWNFIDDIIWLKPEASVKNRNASFGQHRKPLAYKPNPVTEYVMVYRKATDKLLDWNMHQYPDHIAEASKLVHYESSNVWQIAPAADKVHSAVFPDTLARRVIELYSYRGDLVFDPFAGSGTVGVVAYETGRHYLLTEQNESYFERIKERIGAGKYYNMEEFVATQSNVDYE